MELKELSNKFYSYYNQTSFPNILRKKTRSYSIIQIEVDGIKFGIPVKTDIKHSQAFIFKDSGRKKPHEKPGLDFKSAVVITSDEYIGGDGHIDIKESKYLFKNEKTVIYNFSKYVKDYKKYLLNPIGKCWEAWRFSNTALEYFWDELDAKIIDKVQKKMEVKLSYNIYLVIKNLTKDANVKMGDFFIRKISEDSVSISFKNYYILKEFNVNSIGDFVKITSTYNSDGEISHLISMGEKYSDLLKTVIEIKDK